MTKSCDNKGSILRYKNTKQIIYNQKLYNHLYGVYNKFGLKI